MQPEPSPNETSTRVYLAEDDADFRQLMSKMLRRDGFDVVEICEGTHLLKVARRLRDCSSIIVSDIRMPGLTGLEVLSRVRDSPQPRTPFILMTAFGDGETHTMALQLGAVAVFDKPFDFLNIRNCLRGLRAERDDGFFGGPDLGGEG